MGSTFVTLSRESSNTDPGFWMRDGMLELWLRMLALHLPEPTGTGENQATPKIRDQWLLASRGYFTGCIPHGMEDACATEDGRIVVRAAIHSLIGALQRSETPLDSDTLNLFGLEGEFTGPIERRWLRDVGYAFLDLMAGKIISNASSADIMPGAIPYRRDVGNDQHGGE